MSSSQNRRRESLRRFAGLSREGRDRGGRVGAIRGERHEGGRKKEACGSVFAAAVHTRAETEERRCGGLTGARARLSAAAGGSSGTWRHFRGGGAWRKKQPNRRRRRDLRQWQ
ncbi:hypothetical protein Scep_002285 [Stephania cephalantha]|uniref:Uncharacterized protein n=1 Tax=Stephania cephalantha TaxID=152367 RepID=A0AAP0Q5T9_9MAGN